MPAKSRDLDQIREFFDQLSVDAGHHAGHHLHGGQQFLLLQIVMRPAYGEAVAMHNIMAEIDQPNHVPCNENPQVKGLLEKRLNVGQIMKNNRLDLGDEESPHVICNCPG